MNSVVEINSLKGNEMEYITFKHSDGRTFRVSNPPGDMNTSIEQRFNYRQGGNEFWVPVYGPNEQIRNLAIDALAKVFQ